MQASLLESRPLYAIGTVARLTSIKPDTLRVWERCYGLGASHKSATGRRQYTQADLEHLQLVSALVESGVRIGEIASCNRKTLEVMLARAGSGNASTVARKPRVLFTGRALCQWLDEHQGCLAHVDASLARLPLAAAEAALAGRAGPPDLVVVGCETLGPTQVRQAQDLAAALAAARLLVVYGSGTRRALQGLQQQGMSVSPFPPDPGFLAFEFARCATEAGIHQGDTHLGDLVRTKPRQLTEEELAAADSLRPDARDSRPGQLAELVRVLARLEEDIAGGAVSNWPEVAVSACAYAYTGQARWLLEKALQAVLSGRAGAPVSPQALPDPGRLHDAA